VPVARSTCRRSARGLGLLFDEAPFDQLRQRGDGRALVVALRGDRDRGAAHSFQQHQATTVREVLRVAEHGEGRLRQPAFALIGGVLAALLSGRGGQAEGPAAA
jgi:hypothetical protein